MPNDHDTEARPEELEPLTAETLENTTVYPFIHQIRQDVIQYVDVTLTWEGLHQPDVSYSLVLPLHEKYGAIQRRGNRSIVFCFLLNRVHFLRDENFSTQTISRSRALLCELMATRLLKQYGNDLMGLSLALTTSWPVYSGADQDVLDYVDESEEFDERERVGNAIELSIIGKAKRFIKSPPCQKVIDGIWGGKIIYQATSHHSFLADTYKRKPVHFYDPHKAPLLDHYRLKVPAVRSVLEYLNFILLFVLFVVALEGSERDQLNGAEIIFMVYALGFSLEKLAAMQEHGIRVYFTGTWNGFDLLFVTIYAAYAFLRLYGLRYDELWARSGGIDCLALAACLIFPRLAFVTLSNNLMVLALRSMIAEFAMLMFIAAFCFAGFLYALWTLSRGHTGYTAGEIAWWMLDLWFGLDASGFERATIFHPWFGPILMVTYACLSNTLLLTVLVSILSYTFSSISDDASAEAMFRHAVMTIEGVKADALFSYQPPLNLIALFIMLPASYLLTPRWFHKVNVFMIRLTSFPILLLIALYERQTKGHATVSESMTAVAERAYETLPKRLKRISFFDGFIGAGRGIDGVFEVEEEVNGDSALDTRDASTNAGPTVSERKQSHSRHTRASSSYAPAIEIRRSTDPEQLTSPPRSLATSPRVRRLSVTADQQPSMAQNTAISPLAALYRAVTVDEVGNQEIGNDPSGNPQAVGYLPRRRLSSMHRTIAPSPGVAMRRHPTTGSASGSGLLEPMMATLSESPQQQASSLPAADDRDHLSPYSEVGHDTIHGTTGQDPGHLPARATPEPVSEIADEEGVNLSNASLARQLRAMEERQKSIEALLSQIAQQLHK